MEQKNLHLVFINVEKAHDRVVTPREERCLDCICSRYQGYV